MTMINVHVPHYSSYIEPTTMSNTPSDISMHALHVIDDSRVQDSISVGLLAAILTDLSLRWRTRDVLMMVEEKSHVPAYIWTALCHKALHEIQDFI